MSVGPLRSDERITAFVYRRCFREPKSEEQDGERCLKNEWEGTQTNLQSRSMSRTRSAVLTFEAGVELKSLRLFWTCVLKYYITELPISLEGVLQNENAEFYKDDR